MVFRILFHIPCRPACGTDVCRPLDPDYHRRKRAILRNRIPLSYFLLPLVHFFTIWRIQWELFSFFDDDCSGIYERTPYEIVHCIGDLFPNKNHFNILRT